MTSEPKPYTVADLRRWANQHREFACSGYQEIDPAHAADARAQAAAFDALADGIEACEKPVENVGDDYTSKMVRHAMIGTLKSLAASCEGEAVKDREAVRTRYPTAVCEIDARPRDASRPCVVWDAPRIPGISRGCWGWGETPEEAWKLARQTIEAREGRRLPL